MGKKILIADDEKLIRKLIRASLETYNDFFEIHEAENGTEALTKAKNLKPQLLILDIMMPGMLGYEVCRCLKNSPDTKDIFVLFLTARGSDISLKTVEICGGDDFMTKPFNPKELEQKVLKVMGLP